MVWPDLPPRDCCLCRMLLLLPFVWPSAGVIGYTDSGQIHTWESALTSSAELPLSFAQKLGG